MHGCVMLDIAGTELSSVDIEVLQHSATGGVILFSRNFTSRTQIQQLITEIQALRSPSLLIAVDQEGGRVQRFHEAFTRLPAAAEILCCYQDDLPQACHAAHELGWLMAAELRSVGVDFSFAPVLDIDYGISEIIGNRAFARDSKQVSALAQAWMLGAREAGMISVGKHFPGHGAVVADSHLALPIDEREPSVIFKQDVLPFRRLIANGLEAIMPAHVIYQHCDSQLAGFSTYWLQEVLRGELGFQGAIFSDDLSMQATAELGGYAARAQAAIQAGCDMVLVCNNQDAASEVLDTLGNHHDPVSMSRYSRLPGRKAIPWETLCQQPRWQQAANLAKVIVDGN